MFSHECHYTVKDNVTMSKVPVVSDESTENDHPHESAALLVFMELYSEFQLIL